MRKTSTKATEALINCRLYKMLEVDVPTSQSLKIVHPSFKVQKFCNHMVGFKYRTCYLVIRLLFICSKQKYLTGNYYIATFIRQSHCVTIDIQHHLKTSHTLAQIYLMGRRVYALRLQQFLAWVASTQFIIIYIYDLRGYSW